MSFFETVSTIALVRPEQAAQVENMIIGMAQKGSLTAKVSETQLNGLLKQFAEQAANKPKIEVCELGSVLIFHLLTPFDLFLEWLSPAYVLSFSLLLAFAQFQRRRYGDDDDEDDDSDF